MLYFRAMRRIIIRPHAVFFGLALSMAFTASARCQVNSQVEDGIRNVLSGMEEAWNRGDAKAWARYFTRDAEFIDVAGTILDGRDRIERQHAELLGGMLRGSHLTQRLRRIRVLQPEVAIVDADVELYGYQSLPRGFPASGAVLSSRLKHVMVYANGTWWIVASQNTYVPPPPPPED